jgi:RPA family protein/predicted transcriptional regulator
MERKRLTAIKTKIKPITAGKYVSQPGFEPNYVLTSLGIRVSRVRILATVVDKFVSETKKFSSITLDDGSDTIRAKAWNSLILDELQIGDTIDITGKVREYQGEVFIAPELIRKVENPNWEILRELEIKRQEETFNQKRNFVLEYQKQTSDLAELKRMMKERFGINEDDVESIVNSQDMSDEEKPEENNKELILELIVSLDKGQGAEYSEIMEKAGLQEDVLDNVINNLLEEGTCFEPRPGKIKKL